jgi:hypothetical protein
MRWIRGLRSRDIGGWRAESEAVVARPRPDAASGTFAPRVADEGRITRSFLNGHVSPERK